MYTAYTLNFEYIFSNLYQAITGVHVDFSQVPGQVVFWAQTVTIVGMVISVVLLVLIVWVRIRTIVVEEEGFARLDAEERATHGTEEISETKNMRWEAITMMAISPNASDWRAAIIDADTMMQAMLTEHGYIGATLGEQLKNANPLQFTTLDVAWEAHKMRNAIAHMGEAFPLTERDVRATIDFYRRVFEEFQYI